MEILLGLVLFSAVGLGLSVWCLCAGWYQYYQSEQHVAQVLVQFKKEN